MYSMKEAQELTGLSYDTLKFYCNKEIIPNVKRDKNNYRIFSEENIKWINGINCLKNCGMSIQEIKEYVDLCLKGDETIPAREEILDKKLIELNKKKEEIDKSIDYIYHKKEYYKNLVEQKKASY